MAGEEEGMAKPKRARRRKLETAKAGLEPPLVGSGGQGVHREVESEGHEEKHRAVVEGSYPKDEPVGQRWGKVEPALWRAPLTTEELIEEINPIVRGWGLHYKEAHVRRLFHQLDGWIVRRLWSHRFKRWRCQGWKALPTAKVYGELGLVNLVSLIPSLAPQRRASL